jgi:predicted transcriptional regulator
MRTTLTLDDDVAARIEGLRKTRNQSLRDLVNDALREGLKQLAAPPDRPAAFQTEAVDLGRCLVGNVDNVADALAVAEGEAFR